MSLIQFVVYSLALCQFASARRPGRGGHRKRSSDPQATPDPAVTIAITGASSGGSQPRLEIHDLQSQTDQWNIYLLALQRFQEMDGNDPMSWYQIAGIHGQPYIDWDGVGMCSNCTPSGYCTHASTLFPTWHRAYLLLFEQSLQNNALAVADEFTGDDNVRYTQAATSLRIPYWDWALVSQNGEDAFPQMFTDTSVSVNTPTGQQTIPNPLLLYWFGDQDHSFVVSPSADTTVRSPNLNREQLREDLWTALTSQQSFDAFATESLDASGDYNPNSLEAVHDEVHVMIGGDMGNIPSAAFDPVFWLHHAMVDRAFALWQAVNADAWMQPWTEVGSTYTYASGSMENSSSPLEPFHSDPYGDFWSSDAVSQTDALNYHYADLASGESATAIINSLYRDNSAWSSKRSVNKAGNASSTSGAIHEYIVNVKVDSMDTEGSFTVYIFDGPFDDSNPAGWWHEEDLIGMHGFFTGPEALGDGSALVNAGISITAALLQDVQRGRLSDMGHDAVIAYLKKNIEWRIMSLNGSIIPANELSGLEISVVTADVTLPASDTAMPIWESWAVLTEVTEDKIRGYSG